jgi:hypothetical protein
MAIRPNMVATPLRSSVRNDPMLEASGNAILSLNTHCQCDDRNEAMQMPRRGRTAGNLLATLQFG